MKHHFLDHHWKIDSPIHKIEPRIKIIVSFSLLLAVVITPNRRFLDIAMFLPVIIFLLILSKLPLVSIIKRMAVILPLVVLIAASLPFISPGKPLVKFHFIVPLVLTDVGIFNFVSVILKAVGAIWIMTLLTATTRFRDLITGMQKLYFPMIFTSILGFIYRYIFLFTDELEYLNIGRQSRSFGNRPLLSMKGFAYMISSLFLRSFERGERIYQTMAARGFNGQYMTLTGPAITAVDILILSLSLTTILAIKLTGYYYG